MEVITVALIIYGLLCAASCQTERDSCYIRLESPEPRSRLTHGEKLTYMYNMAVNHSIMADEMTVIVNGSNLQMIAGTGVTVTNFTWESTDGRMLETENQAAHHADVQQRVDLVSEITLHLPMSHGEFKLRKFTGQVELYVADYAPLGSLLRAMMYILFHRGGTEVNKTVIFGDYVFTEIPEMQLSSAEPRELEMKETATIMTYVYLPSTPLASALLNVYIPKNYSNLPMGEDDLHIGEPCLTVLDFQSVGSTGLSLESSSRIRDNSPAVMSCSRTSEVDRVVFAIPEIEFNMTKFRNMSHELDFLTKVESLDFHGSHEGEEMRVTQTLDFGEHFIIVRNSSIFVKREPDIERVPRLNFTLNIVDTSLDNDTQTTVQLQLRLWHEVNISWSTAYNVSMLVFLPPFLSRFKMIRSKDVIRTDTPVENILHDNAIELRLPRISFVHNVRIQFSLNLDITHSLYKPGEEYMIIVEARYNSWRNSDIIQEADIFPFVFNFAKDNPNNKPLCECLADSFAQCRCSEQNACSEKNIICVECGVPWRCVNTRTGYGKACYLEAGDNMAYVCNSTSRSKKPRDARACIKQYNNGTVTRLSPVVGTILGREVQRNHLYGISQNGLAYVLSKDEGITWYNIPTRLYAHASLTASFQKAIFK